MTAGALSEILTLLTEDFVALVRCGMRPFLLLEQMLKCVWEAGSVTTFFRIWSDYLQVPPSKSRINPFDSMLLSQGFSSPSNISLLSAFKLFNPLVKYSLTNVDPGYSQIWYNISSLGDQQAIYSVMNEFNLSQV